MSAGQLTVVAPDGLGEVRAGTDLADLVIEGATRALPGGLADGDIVVITSKIVSKAEGRTAPAATREDVIRAESTDVVARRGGVRILRHRSGLTMAAAGVDGSNVAPDTVLLLPVDADASAASLRTVLAARTGATVGVIVSDTAGRAWRIGQTDLAIGAAGVLVADRYAGRSDAYGNPLAVTTMVLADELAAAADLAKRKLAGRPLAFVRGLPELVLPDVADHGEPAAALLRRPVEDLFGRGTREAVLAALCQATGRPEAYAELVELEGSALTDRSLVRLGIATADEPLVRALLAAAAYPEQPPPPVVPPVAPPVAPVARPDPRADSG